MLFENYVFEVIEGNRTAPFGKKLLFALSRVYRAILALRHRAYDTGLKKSYQAPVPVISVGNIVVGGVGKTPLVKKLAEELSKKRKVAILTRGFRGKLETNESVRWQGEEAALSGDEPFWLASKLPQVAVWIGKRRVKSAERAALEGAELLLLDDGMQHRKLKRDADIVVMDAQDLWGRGHFLPRGYLRDFPSRLEHARLIVLMQVKETSDVECAKKALEKYSRAPVVGMSLKAHVNLKGKRVGLFCAIGRPERFLQTVKELGATVCAEMYELDHRSFADERLESFAQQAKAAGAELLVCTEKDSVKLPAGLKLSLPVEQIPVELEIVAGEEHWNHLIEEFSHDRRI